MPPEHDVTRTTGPAPRPRAPTRRAVETGPAGGLLRLQRSAGNSAVGSLLGVQRTVGWSGEKDKSPNKAPRDTKGTKVLRIPVQGIKEGVGSGRAIVVVPHGAAQPPTTVEVLFHMHGFFIPGYGRGYHEHDGEADDEALYKIEQQLEASGRAMIGILPQGPKSGKARDDGAENITQFGADSMAVDLDTYVDQAIEQAKDAWPYTPVPKRGPVVLSGHSGAGAAIADMFKSSLAHDKDPQKHSRLPGRDKLEAFLSFDTINGPNEYKQHREFLVHQLDQDLQDAKQQVSAGAKPADAEAAQAAWLDKQGFRFRGQYSKGYASYYDSPKSDGEEKGLKQRFERWLKDNALPAPVEAAFRRNYTFDPTGLEHMDEIGQKLGPALGSLGSAAPGATAPATTTPPPAKPSSGP